MLRRLPLSGDEIVDVLAGMHPSAASTDDEDHPAFWLVVADQLHRAGIASRATAMALDAISSGAALAVAVDRGMERRDLGKLREKLAQLGEKLGGPLPDKKRRVLKKPQPLLFEPGEVYAFPVDRLGQPVNPYASDARTAASFEQGGWSSLLVTAVGHEFDYLAWYRAAPSRHFSTERPDFATAVSQIDVLAGNLGPLSATGHRRLRLERLGQIDGFVSVEVDPVRVSYTVANDISFAGVLRASKGRPGA